MHILRCMGSKFCVKFQRAPLKFRTKFWTHTPQNMHFTVFSFRVWVTISLNCDVISLSETGPWRVFLDKLHESTKNRWYVHNNMKHMSVFMMTSWQGNIFRIAGLCYRTPPVTVRLSSKQTNKQRVLMHRHQGWNVRHGLCHIYMRYVYIYIWVVYSFCLFCCLFIIVTWWYMWCIVWQVAIKKKYRHVW